MLRLVHIVHRAEEHDGFSEVISVHRVARNAREACVKLNLAINPRMLIAHNDYYVQRYALES